MLEDEEGYAILHQPSLNDRRPANASKGHCTGHLMVGAGPGRVLYVESHLELSWAHCLNAHPKTKVLREQVAFEWQAGPEKYRTHYFDLFVEQTDGRRIAYPVKPEARLSDRFMAEINSIAMRARESGFVDDVRLLTDTDLDPIELSNARLGYGMRMPDPEADEVADGVIAAMSGVVALGDLAGRIGLGPRGYRALIRLVRNGRLRTTRHEHFTHSTEIFNTGAPA